MDELVVRHVLAQGILHPQFVSRADGAAGLSIDAENVGPEVVGIRDIALAGQQLFDKALTLVLVGFAMESLSLFDCRNATSDIEVDTSKKNPVCDLFIRAQLILLQFCLNQLVYSFGRRIRSGSCVSCDNEQRSDENERGKFAHGFYEYGGPRRYLRSGKEELKSSKLKHLFH